MWISDRAADSQKQETCGCRCRSQPRREATLWRIRVRDGTGNSDGRGAGTSSSNIAFLTTASIPVSGTVSSAGELRLNGSTILKETMSGYELVRLVECT